MRVFKISPFQINTNFQIRENQVATPLSRGGALTLNRDTVSFGCESEEIKKTYYIPVPTCKKQRLRELKGVPCIYCGDVMLNDEEVKSLGNKMHELHGQALIDFINEHKNLFRKNRKKVVNEILNYLEEHPEADLKTSVNKLAIKAIEKLQDKQLSILNETYKKNRGKFKKSSDHDAWLFKNIIKEGRSWVRSENNDDTFKRKDFIECCKKRLESIHNKKLARRIVNDLEQLPTSINDHNAYMVKYSRRSSKEIAETLFSEATSSIEHIRPQSEYDIVNGQWKNRHSSWHEGDKDNIANLALACRGCNSERKSIPLSIYCENKPEIQLYAEEQLNYILENTPYGDYVADVAKTLEEESCNKLDLSEFYLN